MIVKINPRLEGFIVAILVCIALWSLIVLVVYCLAQFFR